MRTEHDRIDQPPVDRGQRQGLEAEHRPVAAGDRPRLDEDQVLDANAVGTAPVIARLVREDHAGLQRHRASLGDALRTLVDREEGADAVAGAVVVIEPGFPQAHPGEGIDLRARRPLGKDRAGDGDVALQHAGEAIAHRVRGRADGDGAGDVGGAVSVLRAGIDQEEFAGLRRAVGGAGDAVMDDGTVRARAGNGREGDIAQQAALLAEILQRLDGGDLAHPLGRSPVEPGEEARHGKAVAVMGGAGAGDLGRVLDRLHRGDRIGADIRDAAGGLDAILEGRRRRRRIDPHAGGAGAQAGEIRVEGAARAKVGQRFEGGAQVGVDLRRGEIERGPPLTGHQRVAEREGRVCDVGPTQVEGPGEVVGIGDHQGVDPAFRQRGADAIELLAARLARKIIGMGGDTARRRPGPPGPDRVHEIIGHGAQGCPRLDGGALQAGHAVGRMKPGIVGEGLAGLQVGAEPSLRRRLGKGHDGDDPGIDLFRGLEGVAAIDEQGRLVGQDHREAGRPGEAGEPSEPLGVGRHVFRLMLVGPGHDEAVGADLAERRAQGFDPFRPLGVAGIVEGLEAGQGRRHGGNLPRRMPARHPPPWPSLESDHSSF